MEAFGGFDLEGNYSTYTVDCMPLKIQSRFWYTMLVVGICHELSLQPEEENVEILKISLLMVLDYTTISVMRSVSRFTWLSKDWKILQVSIKGNSSTLMLLLHGFHQLLSSSSSPSFHTIGSEVAASCRSSLDMTRHPELKPWYHWVLELSFKFSISSMNCLNLSSPRL